MKYAEVEECLTRFADAAHEWEVAVAKYESDLDRLLTTLINEAVANFMSAEMVAGLSGITTAKVRARMRAAGLDPKRGTRFLAKQASSALIENANLLGIEPGDMDLTSPLAYLPMGKELREALEAIEDEKVEEDEPVLLTRGSVIQAVVGEDTANNRVITATLRVVGWTATPGQLVVTFEDAK